MWLRHGFAVVALVSISFQATAGDKVEPVAVADLRAAAAKALERIQQSQAISIRKENCASCHHQLLPELPLALARQRGVAFDEALARKNTTKTFGFLKDLDAMVQGHEFIDITFDGQMLITASVAGILPNLSTTTEALFVLGRQLPDGSWRIMDGRPPQSHSRFACVAYCAQAVRKYLPDSMQAEKDACVRKARAWLLNNEPGTTEDRVGQLFGLLWTGADKADRKKAAQALLAQQREDGGWSQLPTRESDAYATGSVLAVLHLSAGLATGDAAYQHGLTFLLKSRQPDGTWHVASRMNSPAPVSPPYFSSGFPYDKDQFVSIMGTTWAATALLLALPTTGLKPTGDGFPDVAPAVKDEWIQVALTGSADDLKKLLDGGLKPNAATAGGSTLLMFVARDLAKVKLLLDRGADVNARAKTGFNALLIASRFAGNAEVVKMLLKAGAKPNPEKGVDVLNSASAIFFAATTGDVPTATALLDAGAIPGYPPRRCSTPLLSATRPWSICCSAAAAMPTKWTPRSTCRS